MQRHEPYSDAANTPKYVLFAYTSGTKVGMTHVLGGSFQKSGALVQTST